MRTSAQRLKDILLQLQRVERFVTDGEAIFLQSDEKQYAVMLAYIIIGEAAKNLPDSLLETRAEIDWKQIKGFRDFLIHNYHRVVSTNLWEAVEDLPTLRAAVEAMLRDLETESGDTTAE
jgi:uncharacterized protein with HEPN domain